MGSSQPNVLWITLDSVRADHTSLHDYRRNTTPELARIAASNSGLNFEHAIAHSTRTPVSVPSMLTGLPPSRHRMIGTRSGDALPESMTTTPELLAAQGYQTIGVSENGYAGKAKRIDERFETFVNSSPGPTGFLTRDLGISLLKYGFNLNEHGPGLTLDIGAHRKQSSFFTTDIAKRKLRAATQSDYPFFCYVHYNDPHHPYIPPVDYRDEYSESIDASAEEAVAFAQQMHDDLYELMSEGVPLSEAEWSKLYAMYDSTIKYTDACVGELFEFVQETAPNTIVVITADHGDLFGEYGLLGHHMVLHDGLTHVPLVTHNLRGVEGCTDTPVQHTDVMKTILSAVGADTKQFVGYDLREECRTRAVSQDLRGSVDDDQKESYERIKQYNSKIDLSHLPESLVTAVRTTEFKLVQTADSSVLYQLPDEQTDVRDEFPKEYERLRGFLEEWNKKEGQPFEATPNEAELTEETEQHLREMGYLS